MLQAGDQEGRGSGWGVAGDSVFPWLWEPAPSAWLLQDCFLFHAPVYKTSPSIPGWGTGAGQDLEWMGSRPVLCGQEFRTAGYHS